MALERSEIEEKYKWDLTVLYKNEEEFYLDFKKTEELIESFKGYEKTMLDSASELYAALQAMTDIENAINKLWLYASLSFSTDTSNNAHQALTGKVRSLAVSAGTASWFVSPYILRLDEEKIEEWYREYPKLTEYRRTIYKTLRGKPYTLSDECEQLMSKVEDCLYAHSETRQIFANSDISFGTITDEEGKSVELTDTNYIPFMMSKNRRVRREAFETLYKTYRQFGNTFATIYNSHVKENTTLARVRSFPDSITASTFRDEVTPVIYNNLIDTVNKGLPALYEYYELKRQVLGVEELHMYDVYAPLIDEFERKYTYEEAVDEVLKTVGVYGKEYYDVLSAGLLEKGWVDVFPTRSKRGGAFSSGAPGTEPYILLNFTDNYDDVSTLAHEAGHSMHTYFSNTYNKPQDSQYTIFVAEVASTVNELLLAHRKIKEASSREEKLFLLNQLIETYKGTLFRQTMFAEFERDMHALSESGEPLTSELIRERYYDIILRYFGEGVVCDKEIECEWMRIPHFYTCFYVYKYATCISAASLIVKRIETEGEAYVSRYIDFLKCGGAKSPLDSLLVAGVDMTKPEVVTSAIEDFKSCVEEFRRVYNGEN